MQQPLRSKGKVDSSKLEVEEKDEEKSNAETRRAQRDAKKSKAEKNGWGGDPPCKAHLGNSLGNREDEQGDVIVPVGAIEIRQSIEDLILDFVGS